MLQRDAGCDDNKIGVLDCKVEIHYENRVMALLFGTTHVSVAFVVTGDWRVLLNAIPYAAMGLGLSINYEKSHSLVYSMMLHMLINLIATSGSLS